MVKAQEAEFLQVHILIFKIFDQLDNVDLRHLKEHSRGLISFEWFLIKFSKTQNVTTRRHMKLFGTYMPPA